MDGEEAKRSIGHCLEAKRIIEVKKGVIYLFFAIDKSCDKNGLVKQQKKERGYSSAAVKKKTTTPWDEEREIKAKDLLVCAPSL